MNPRMLLFLIAFSFAVNVASAQTPPADANAKLISGPQFVLSDEAVSAGIEGKIVVAFTVDKDGKITIAVPYAGPSWPCGTRPIKQLEDMWEAIRQNVRASHFSPAIKNGKPISFNLEMTYLVGQAYRDAIERQKQRKDVRKENADPWLEGGVINGKAVKLPKPGYPSDAPANRVSGAVSVEVLIDESGKVIRAGAVSGHPLLQASSREAACDAKFSPTLLQGRPVKVSGIITYNFIP